MKWIDKIKRFFTKQTIKTEYKTISQKDYKILEKYIMENPDYIFKSKENEMDSTL